MLYAKLEENTGMCSFFRDPLVYWLTKSTNQNVENKSKQTLNTRSEVYTVYIKRDFNW